MNRFGLLIAVIALSLTSLLMIFRSLAFMEVANASHVPDQDSEPIFLPAIYGTSVSPSGTYSCYETEFGLIWASEVITLHPDGSSVYAY
jgi:hypothetical protein